MAQAALNDFPATTSFPATDVQSVPAVGLSLTLEHFCKNTMSLKPTLFLLRGVPECHCLQTLYRRAGDTPGSSLRSPQADARPEGRRQPTLKAPVFLLLCCSLHLESYFFPQLLRAARPQRWMSTLQNREASPLPSSGPGPRATSPCRRPLGSANDYKWQRTSDLIAKGNDAVSIRLDSPQKAISSNNKKKKNGGAGCEDGRNR